MGHKVGRKFGRLARKVGQKFMHSRARIGRKFVKAGRIAGRIAPFLSAIPAIGPELSLAAAGASTAAQGVGTALQSRGVRKAGSSLVDAYAQHKAARHG